MNSPDPCSNPKEMAAVNVEKAFFYSTSPKIILGQSGKMADKNAACDQLFGKDTAGCKGQHFKYFIDRIRPRCSGPILPPNGVFRRHLCNDIVVPSDLSSSELRPAITGLDYDSPAFGLVRLRVIEIPNIHPTTGRCAGSLLSFEIDPSLEEIRNAIDKRLAHELMWEVYATSYDRILPHLPFYTECVDRHLNAVNQLGKATVLDVGSGTGIATEMMLRAGHRVTAVEPNRAMLRSFHLKQSEDVRDRLRIIEDTAEELPHLDTESFDVVTVLLAFFDMQDPHSALSEAKRLLTSGGTLIVTEPSLNFNVEHLMKVAEDSLKEQGLLRSLFEDWKNIQSVAPIISNTIRKTQSHTNPRNRMQAFTAESIHENLIDEGYADVVFTPSHAGNCATVIGVKP